MSRLLQKGQKIVPFKLVYVHNVGKHLSINSIMRHFRLIVILSLTILLSGCEKFGLDVDPPSKVSWIFEGKTETSITSRLILAIDDDKIRSYGVCWSEEATPTLDNGNVKQKPDDSRYYSVEITGLQAYTKYFLRPFATNRGGTTYGEEIVCWTQPFDGTEVADMEGNIYHTVKIGDQVWFVENLKSTRFQNGDRLTNLRDNAHVDSSTYCYYKYDLQLGNSYGYLYNYNVMLDPRNIAPIGWHIPTKDDWNELVHYLGGWSDVAQVEQKLMETGNNHWTEANGSTNESGFTARGGGYCSSSGRFYDIKESANWWISYNTEYLFKFFIVTRKGFSNIGWASNSSHFLSIRCIQDETTTFANTR